MGNRADQGSPATTGGAAGSTNTTGESGADEGANDLIHVCRSAMLWPAEYQLYRAILLAFPEAGGPPDRAALRQLARRFGVRLEATLAIFAREDLIQRDPTTGAIRVAYPFSGVPTAHHITLLADSGNPSLPSNPDGAAGNPGTTSLSLYAMCALDALGAPLMLHRNAFVASVDPLTGEEIRVHIWQANAPSETEDAEAAASGKYGGLPGWQTQWEPRTAVVYARPEDHTADTYDMSDIAAACRCPVTNFFAAMSHARRWEEQHGSPGDVILASSEALQRADRRFDGILDRLTSITRTITGQDSISDEHRRAPTGAGGRMATARRARSRSHGDRESTSL